jgi:hypothetical protein
MKYIVEKVDRESYFDRVYTPDEFREEIHVRNEHGTGFFKLAVIEADEKPDAVGIDDPRFVDVHPYSFIQ